jgi:hypothetical protein
MEILIKNFMDQMYWIDVSAIIAITLFFGFKIHFWQSKYILKNNTEYNESLRSMREEIYHECEKNFFL